MGIAGKAPAVMCTVKTGSKDHISSIMNVVSGIAISPHTFKHLMHLSCVDG